MLNSLVYLLEIKIKKKNKDTQSTTDFKDIYRFRGSSSE